MNESKHGQRRKNAPGSCARLSASRKHVQRIIFEGERNSKQKRQKIKNHAQGSRGAGDFCFHLSTHTVTSTHTAHASLLNSLLDSSFILQFTTRAHRENTQVPQFSSTPPIPIKTESRRTSFFSNREVNSFVGFRDARRRQKKRNLPVTINCNYSSVEINDKIVNYKICFTAKKSLN